MNTLHVPSDEPRRLAVETPIEGVQVVPAARWESEPEPIDPELGWTTSDEGEAAW